MTLHQKKYKNLYVKNTSFRIPIVDSDMGYNESISVPEWMIQVDDILSSSIKNFENFSELYGWYSDRSRLTKGRTANNLFSTSAIQHSNVLAVLPAGIYFPTLENKMNRGTNISFVLLVRLTNVGQTREIQQIILYTDCKIESIQQQLDEIIVSFRPESCTNIIFKYTQQAVLEGQSVSFYDYVKGKNLYGKLEFSKDFIKVSL